jgi:hypothetical protein
MLNRKQKILVSFATITSTGTAFALCNSCCPLYLNEIVAPAFVYATTSIIGAMSAVDVALAAQLQFNSERLTSAIAILTKQKAVGANQVNEAGKNAAQVTAQALNSLAQTDRVKQARFDYGGEFGQGYSPCKVSATRNFLQSNIEQTNNKTLNDVNKEIIASAGAYVSKEQTINDRIKQYQEHYCSLEQVKYGMCDKVGELAGKSVSIATLFSPSSISTKEYQAKLDFINSISGLPDNPIPEQNKTSSLSRSYMLMKHQKDASVSPAYYSLKKIQNDYIEPKGIGSSVAEMFESEVARYMGVGNEGGNWAKSIAIQNQRGLLVELLKVKALDLSIQSRQYEQQERMEANLAVLVANVAQNLGRQANTLQNHTNMQQ